MFYTNTHPQVKKGKVKIDPPAPPAPPAPPTPPAPDPAPPAPPVDNVTDQPTTDRKRKRGQE